MDLKGKKLLLLGGKTLASVDIVNYAKSKGVYTIVADYLSAEESPAKRLAHEGWDISTGDTVKLVEKIRENKVDGVFAGIHEFNLSKMIDICDELKFPCYCSRQKWDALTNKNIVKKYWNDFHIGTAHQYTMEMISEANYPLIVKPVDGSSADGISVCKDYDELCAAISKAEAVSSRNEVVIEEYIEGDECTVFYLIIEGNVFLTGLANRHIKQTNANIIPLPVAYSMPSKYLREYLNDVDENVRKWFAHMQLTDGMVFMQAKMKDGKFYFYDFGYRLTGSMEYKLLEKMYGFNPMKMMVDYSLTGKMYKEELKQPDLKKMKSGNITFLVKPGKIDKIVGLEEVKKIKGVIDTYCTYKEGDELSEDILGTLRQVIIRVFFVTETVEEMKDVMDQIYRIVNVYDADGDSMLLPGFETDRLVEDVLI